MKLPALKPTPKFNRLQGEIFSARLPGGAGTEDRRIYLMNKSHRLFFLAV
jgi:hypothetical protein